jgi:hypothetical protein
MGVGGSLLGVNGWGVKVTTHLHLATRLWISGAILYSLLYVFMARMGTTASLTLPSYVTISHSLVGGVQCVGGICCVHLQSISLPRRHCWQGAQFSHTFPVDAVTTRHVFNWPDLISIHYTLQAERPLTSQTTKATNMSPYILTCHDKRWWLHLHNVTTSLHKQD